MHLFCAENKSKSVDLCPTIIRGSPTMNGGMGSALSRKLGIHSSRRSTRGRSREKSVFAQTTFLLGTIHKQHPQKIWNFSFGHTLLSHILLVLLVCKIGRHICIWMVSWRLTPINPPQLHDDRMTPRNWVAAVEYHVSNVVKKQFRSALLSDHYASKCGVKAGRIFGS